MRPRSIAHDKLTSKQKADVIHWYKERFGLEGWVIDVCLSPVVPEWVMAAQSGHYGLCNADHEDRIAKIWINMRQHAADNIDCLATLFHELGHIAHQSSIADPDRDATVREEFLIDRTAITLTEAYRAGV